MAGSTPPISDRLTIGGPRARPYRSGPVPKRPAAGSSALSHPPTGRTEQHHHIPVTRDPHVIGRVGWPGPWKGGSGHRPGGRAAFRGARTAVVAARGGWKRGLQRARRRASSAMSSRRCSGRASRISSASRSTSPGDLGTPGRRSHAPEVRFSGASRAKCCGCTGAFQALRAGSIPVARSEVRNTRGVAQSGSAPGWGPGGRRFKSCLPDSEKACRYGPFRFDVRRADVRPWFQFGSSGGSERRCRARGTVGADAIRRPRSGAGRRRGARSARARRGCIRRSCRLGRGRVDLDDASPSRSLVGVLTKRRFAQRERSSSSATVRMCASRCASSSRTPGEMRAPGRVMIANVS